VHTPGLDDVSGQLAREPAPLQGTTPAAAPGDDEVLRLARQEWRMLCELGPSGPAAPTAVAGPPALPGPAGEQAAELHRTGALWRLRFAGSTVHVPDGKGMRDLAVLLAGPGREVAALDLATTALASAPGVAQRAGTSRDDLQPPGDLGERLDARARAAYTARIRELQAELDDADAAGDADRGARASEEMELLATELAGAYGMRGPRRTGDPAERARSAVTARIRSAIAKIDDVDPMLGAHLARSVHTGRFCSYRPEQPTRWRVTT
jgi:hypothetical protein